MYFLTRRKEEKKFFKGVEYSSFLCLFAWKKMSFLDFE